ncbi:hypothetical protein M011DRAFT_409809 [Sporormia fimetaria CBS 119925]|uniref:Uncharacterized protein n=1 Tax=Sporormia fimetaria CBS 119925 TaxID=1340428 RepID=A0A6A6V1W7_9PLEO|nr:hypothetical protein M011DRAFT_409809 [Sporormia fimetaria CBS 119925]
MITALFLHYLLSFLRIPTVVSEDHPFNNPPGVDIWCGKAYRATNSSFDPGGRLSPPRARDQFLKLDLRIYPRYNFYTSSERTASFIVDTPVQHVSGLLFKNETWEKGGGKKPLTELMLRVANTRTNRVLVNWVKIPVNAFGTEIEFDLSSMPADIQHPWHVHAIAASPDAALQTFYSGTTVRVLPERNDTGSMTRIDYLHGGLQVKSSLTNNEWKPLYSYGFYTSWDWIKSTLTDTSATKTLHTYRSNGYNLIHPVPPGDSDPFDATLFEQFLTICDSLSLYVMYDMRHTYQNTTSMTTQLSRLQNHPSLLLYYTADEPDGHGDPLNATALAYNHIRKLDPYHPISLVLNCANFYFAEYSSGADILLEDTYPIAVNTSFSTVYNTPCNTTYGCCGCDNCHANNPAYPSYTTNAFLDIIERVQDLQRYQEWLGAHAKKPIWGVPQAFFDRGSFWERWPSEAESAVMAVLRLNHGAMGIVGWVYPTSEGIERVSGRLAGVVTGERVGAYTLGVRRVRVQVLGAEGRVDVSAWVGERGVLISYVFVSYEALDEVVEFVLPGFGDGERVVESLWGGEGWEVVGGETRLRKRGLVPLDVGILEVRFLD